MNIHILRYVFRFPTLKISLWVWTVAADTRRLGGRLTGPRLSDHAVALSL